jgi:hypothetical protein
MWNWTAHYTHCCVCHEHGLFECIVEGTTLLRVWGIPDCNHRPLLTRKCVCCFPESVYKIHLEIMRLPWHVQSSCVDQWQIWTSHLFGRCSPWRHISSLPCSGKLFRTDIDFSIWCNSSGCDTDKFNSYAPGILPVVVFVSSQGFFFYDTVHGIFTPSPRMHDLCLSIVFVDWWGVSVESALVVSY